MSGSRGTATRHVARSRAHKFEPACYRIAWAGAPGQFIGARRGLPVAVGRSDCGHPYRDHLDFPLTVQIDQDLVKRRIAKSNHTR